jgi:hypothetical protein
VDANNYLKMNTTQKNRCTRKKEVVYQVLHDCLEIKYQQTLGNIEENGVGKFNDFTPTALQKLRI